MKTGTGIPLSVPAQLKPPYCWNPCANFLSKVTKQKENKIKGT